jgi:predicted PurR-regulated permease PerM
MVGPLWSQASSDLPGLLQRFQPKAGELARSALAMVANLGGGILQLLAAFCVAGILVTQGRPAQARARGLAFKLAGPERGEHFTALCTATIRAVARGVIGVACVQAIVVGICLMLAGVPAPGLLALVTLVLGIAQVPAALVTLPAIGYVWTAGGHSPVVAVLLTLLLFVAGLADNVLKPLLLGRGVNAPMPVILLGALGGMAHSGILGLFVGSTLLTLGYQILVDWVETPEDAPALEWRA